MADALYSSISWMLGNAARLAQRRLSAGLAEHSITPPQWAVLAALWQKDSLTLSAIAQETAFDGPTMTGIIDRLESAGFVQRQRTSHDRRVITVHLTDAGRHLEAVLPPLVLAAEEDILATLDASQVPALFAMLRELVAHLSAGEPRSTGEGPRARRSGR